MNSNFKKISLSLLALLLNINVISAGGSSSWRMSSLSMDVYGKPCINGTSPDPASNLVNCPKAQNMVCSAKQICECAPSSEFKLTEYDQEALACLPIPTPNDDFRCQTNYQCKVSSYGQHSRCNPDMGTCECYHETAKVELVRYVCYIVKPVPFGETYPTCQNNDECTRSKLGNMSRCNEASQRCECHDTATGGKNQVGYYDGVCIFIKKLGEFCTKDEECRAGYHKNAVCQQSPSFLPGEKVCECPENTDCDSNGGSQSSLKSYGVMGLTTVILGFIATKIIH